MRRLQLGAGLLDIRSDAIRALEALEEWTDEGRVRADVVGHSMGGLVATYLLKCLDAGRCVRRVVTLGTPHRGTPLAIPGAALLGLLSPAVWQMLPDSELLAELAEEPVPEGSEILSLAGSDDGIVPPDWTRLDARRGQWNAEVRGADHLDLVHDPVCMEVVARLLASSPAWGHP